MDGHAPWPRRIDMGAQFELRDHVIAGERHSTIKLHLVEPSVRTHAGVLEQLLEFIKRGVCHSLAPKQLKEFTDGGRHLPVLGRYVERQREIRWIGFIDRVRLRRARVRCARHDRGVCRFALV